MYFTRLHLFVAGLLSASGSVSAGRHSRRGVECLFETPAESGETCESLGSIWGLSVDDFTKINPGVTCPDLEAGKPYCVVGEWYVKSALFLILWLKRDEKEKENSSHC